MKNDWNLVYPPQTNYPSVTLLYTLLGHTQATSTGKFARLKKQWFTLTLPIGNKVKQNVFVEFKFCKFWVSFKKQNIFRQSEDCATLGRRRWGAGVVLEIDSTTVQVRDFPSPQMLSRPASQMCEVGAQMLSNCHHRSQVILATYAAAARHKSK